MSLKSKSMAMLMIVCMTNVAFLASTLFAVCQSEPRIKLSRKIQKELDEVAFPAMDSGDDATFYDSFGAVVSGQKPSVVHAIEAYASSLQRESPLNHLIELKLMRIEQGIDSADEKMSVRQTMYLIQGINNRLAEFYQSVEDHPYVAEKISVSDDWKQSRDLFWVAHVLKNEFANFEAVLNYGNVVLGRIRSRLKNMEREQQQQVVDFERHWDRFPQLRQRLAEGEAAARLIRFEESAKELPLAKSFDKRFVAAMNVELDSESLLSVLSDVKVFDREELNLPNLASEIEGQVVEFRSMYPELMKKASLFRSGSHWWLRGRYGQGALANGLLKPRNAIKSDEAMTALYMPRNRPIPEDNFIGSGGEGGTQPYFKRRHYYTWALEHRPILTEHDSKVSRSTAKVDQLLSIESTVSQRDFFY